MGKFKDLSGQKFGRWTVLEKTGVNNSNKILYKCVCECGKVKNVVGANLVNGRTISCGCLQKEIASSHKKHGMTDGLLYSTWKNMLSRCYWSKNKYYKLYGGRGIKVCDRWHEFYNFYNDLIKDYKTGLTLDRIDVNGNYEPNNCRWATQKEQTNNMRKNVFITINNETRTVSQWCDKYNLNRSTIYSSIQRGKNPVDAITTHIK